MAQRVPAAEYGQPFGLRGMRVKPAPRFEPLEASGGTRRGTSGHLEIPGKALAIAPEGGSSPN